MSHIALSTRALASVPTSVFLEKSVVGSDLSDIWVLNLLVVSVLRVTVLVARMVLATFPTWVLLVTSTSTSFLVFLGAGEGSGLSFLLLHVELLDLSFNPVHLHGSLLRVGAVVLGNLETDDTRVDGGLDLAFCTV